MEKINPDLSNLSKCFPDNFTNEQIAKAQTIFYKKLADSTHRFYGGKV